MSQDRTPPGPDGLPFIGSMPKYGIDPFEYRKEWAEEYGDIVHIDGGIARDGYLITDRELFEKILVTEDEKYARPREYTDVFRESIGASEGEFWRKQRDLIEPAFYPARIKEYGDTIRSCVESTVEAWETGDVVDAEAEMKDLTLRVFVKSMFGLEGMDNFEAIREACEAISNKSAAANQVFPQWFPTSANRRYEKASDALDEALDEIIQSHKRGKGKPDTLLSTLIGAESDSDHQMSDEVLRNELVALLFAGHETSSLSLTYTWHLLSRNPEKREKLFAEVDEMLGDEPVSTDQISELNYTDNVIKESMRVLCPAHSIFRTPQETVRVRGYDIPEDAVIFLPIWLLHHDEQYFDNPMEFRPERWETGLEHSLPQHAYMPFGAGPHRCVGEMFAKIELRVAVPTLAQHAQLDIVGDESLEFRASLTAEPKNDIDMQVTRR